MAQFDAILDVMKRFNSMKRTLPYYFPGVSETSEKQTTRAFAFACLTPNQQIRFAEIHEFYTGVHRMIEIFMSPGAKVTDRYHGACHTRKAFGGAISYALHLLRKEIRHWKMDPALNKADIPFSDLVGEFHDYMYEFHKGSAVSQ